MPENPRTVQREDLYRTTSEREEDLERLEAMMHSYASCSEGSLPLNSLMHPTAYAEKTPQAIYNPE